MNLIARIAAALVTGGLLAQVYGLHPIWPLAWLAPIPLLVAIYGAPRWQAFVLGALAGALSIGGMFAYLLSLSGPVPLAIIAAANAITWGATALAVRGVSGRLPHWAGVLIFPALMAAIEVLIAQISPHGSAGSLAYSQMDFLPVIQVAALGGAPAVTFIVTLFASGVASAFWKRAPAPAIAPLLVVAAALGFGFASIAGATPPSQGRDLRVAIIANDQFSGIPQDWRPVWDAYAAQIEHAAEDDHRLVVLPEKIAFLSNAERDAALERFAALARSRDIVIVLGIDVEADGKRFNRAYVFRPDAETLAYDKRHVVPGLEGYFALGTSSLTFERGSTRIGVAICKDMDFPTLGRSYPGARIMLVPAWDFGVDRWLHSRMAMLRGVENGYTIVRSARDGQLTVSDRYGRVLAEAQSGPHVMLTTAAPLGAPGPTLYERIGDAFGWACWVLFALLLGAALIARRRAGQGDTNAD